MKIKSNVIEFIKNSLPSKELVNEMKSISYQGVWLWLVLETVSLWHKFDKVRRAIIPDCVHCSSRHSSGNEFGIKPSEIRKITKNALCGKCSESMCRYSKIEYIFSLFVISNARKYFTILAYFNIRMKVYAYTLRIFCDLEVPYCQLQSCMFLSENKLFKYFTLSAQLLHFI